MVIIRPAGEQDLEQLVVLLRMLFAIEEDFEIDSARQDRGLRLMLNSDFAKVLVADVGGRVVGMVTGQVVVSTAEGGPSVLVEDMVVVPEWRGRGTGRALLDGLRDWAGQQGATRMQLLADANNQSALGYYHHLGWQETVLVCRRMHI